jgi:hypothetical protein
MMAAILFIFAGVFVMIFMTTRVYSFGYDRGDGTAFLIGLGLIGIALI